MSATVRRSACAKRRVNSFRRGSGFLSCARTSVVTSVTGRAAFSIVSNVRPGRASANLANSRSSPSSMLDHPDLAVVRVALHVVEDLPQRSWRAAAELSVADDGQPEAGPGQGDVNSSPVLLTEEAESSLGIAARDGEDRQIRFASLDGIDRFYAHSQSIGPEGSQPSLEFRYLTAVRRNYEHVQLLLAFGQVQNALLKGAIDAVQSVDD